eukprot:CAMPEP_0167747156 /NCGR_PEP_ID=MMETSP0110_2-20121227/4124_1 /TAXON_ID=629695 /ORGANISM="Gymnochlora sp., Strain CCMP2014" /LENGTH=405 /DNA_ID=CAMNT_0007632025 /DNA_START=82 /DNA_END=1299 /DNA_ORIENTATION=-
MWANVPMGPKDPILGVTEAFQADTNPSKLNLGVGAYRDDNGKPWTLPSVQEACERIVKADYPHEYAPIAGFKTFVDKGLKLAYGDDCEVLNSGSVAGIQALSGTGSLRICGEFVSRFSEGTKPDVYVPDPTWGNHIPIMQDSGLKVKKYRYYDKKTNGVDFSGLMEDLKAAPDKSVILMHVCAHNPTGADPTLDQWAEISALAKKKGHFVVMDSAYQGFASGDPDVDAASLRMFVKDGHQIALCQSFAKNFGLYGHRIGTFSMVCADPEEAKKVESQLKILARPMYSNPPIQGANIINTILDDPALKQQWFDDVKLMADRIISMRQGLTDALVKNGSTEDWAHINAQIGMFCFSGLTPEQCDLLASDHSVYLTRNGRISMAGVTSKNTDYLANAIVDVRKKAPAS